MCWDRIRIVVPWENDGRCKLLYATDSYSIKASPEKLVISRPFSILFLREITRVNLNVHSLRTLTTTLCLNFTHFSIRVSS